ncbi:hypothetical protein EON63_23230 [archaeon]|nr:MAG: hypothetical protein EON63_23230 [archaeon]
MHIMSTSVENGVCSYFDKERKDGGGGGDAKGAVKLKGCGVCVLLNDENNKPIAPGEQMIQVRA